VKPEKPEFCPYCGKRPKVLRGGPHGRTWYVECYRFGDHQLTIQNNESRKAAISAWNDPCRKGAK
jgi:hypothetical protein